MHFVINRIPCVIAFFAGVCAAALPCFGVNIDVGTDVAANWKLTGAGASGVTPWQLSQNISITSDGRSPGTFVSGGSLAQFTGFWYADESIALPADATGVSLTFSGLTADDRVVLQLNGVAIGDFFLGNPNGGAGVMSLLPGPPDSAYVFTGQTSGTITSGFVPGQNNLLRVIVNNTGSPVLTSPTVTFGTTSDGTDVGFAGTLTYSVPEPGSLVALSLGSMFILASRVRRRA